MDDLISRQDAINAISEFVTSMSVCESVDECHGMKRMQGMAVRALDAMPSAERKGKWIKAEKHYSKDDDNSFYYYEIRCSECGAMRKIGWTGANFCPNCGADMRGEEDEDR